MRLRWAVQMLRRNLRETLVLCSIPVVLAFLYYAASISLQEYLTLNHTNPRWFAFWTNAFVHEHQQGDAHLVENVVAYLLLVFPAFALFRIRGVSRRFWVAFVLIVLIGPVVSSVSSYIAFHEILALQIQNDRGFSGVVGAFDGFLIVTILYVLGREQPEPVALLSMGLYFAYLLMGLGATTGRVTLLAVGVVVLLATTVAGRSGYVARWSELSEWGYRNRRLGIALVVACFVSTLAFAAALPSDITTGGSVTNIVAHGAGILFGMLVGAVTPRLPV